MSDDRRRRFEGLFLTHYEAVLAYARRRTASEQAQDVVAETFTVAWRRLADVPENARPWLYAVARRVLANQRRGEQRRSALAERVASEPSPAAAPPPALARGSQLARVLEQLPEQEREALLLIAWDGMTPKQAAASLGCSRVALRVRLHRARARLTQELEAGEDERASPRPDFRTEEA